MHEAFGIRTEETRVEERERAAWSFIIWELRCRFIEMHAVVEEEVRDLNRHAKSRAQEYWNATAAIFREPSN